MSESIFGFSAQRLDGREESLDAYRGKVLLIVNTASECGFTPQYAGLEALYRMYGDRGFVVLGFPCNQFGAQEPGDAAAISRFCEMRFAVTFPLFAKVEVNGEAAHPLYVWLKQQAAGGGSGEDIQWNFTKFLVDRAGRVVERYPSATKPEDIAATIEGLL